LRESIHALAMVKEAAALGGVVKIFNQNLKT
jgi:hypothetical protein